MLLFLLLLVFAAVLQHERASGREAQNQLQRLNQRVNELEKDRQLLAEQNKQLQELAGRPNKFDDYFRELVIARRENESLRNQVAGLIEKSRTGAEFERLVTAANLQSKTSEEIIRGAKAEERAQQVLLRAGIGGTAGDPNVKDFARSVGDLLDSNGRLQGQVANLERRNGPGGTEMPPCWVTSTGEIEYIFDVELTSEATRGRMIMHDGAVTGHDEERARLFHALKFNESLTDSDFLDETQPFYAFGKAQNPECRFFVRVLDHTGPNEKELFKRLLQTVERHFYKKLLPNDNADALFKNGGSR